MIGLLRVGAVGFALLLALAACETRPRPPLYSPLATVGSFGYFDEALGGDRVRVGYRAPIARASSLTAAERRREGERLITLSYDLALLRAAEIASERGAASFDVTERENDVDAAAHTHFVPDPFYPPWPYWHHRYRPFPLYGPGHVERFTEVAAGVTFVAQLHDRPGVGAFDTAETLARLRLRHPPPVPSGGGGTIRGGGG
ncbi:MAG: hypothetical protein ACK4QW_13045 [Alphaproteobacteria bacterium]